MIQKKSILFSCTSYPALKIKTFHIFSKKKTIRVFFFTKNSIKSSLKKNQRLLGKKIFSFFSRQTASFRKKDNSLLFFFKNESLILKKKNKILGNFVLGPCLYDNFFLKKKNIFSKKINVTAI